MLKYWNPRRIKRVRAREKLRQERRYEKSKAELEKSKGFTAGDEKKNARLIFNALGLPVRRKMIAYVAREGAMSLSKLARPFRLPLPTAQFHLAALERAGVVTTHKQGRVRMIMYNRGTMEEFAAFVSSRTPAFE